MSATPGRIDALFRIKAAACKNRVESGARKRQACCPHGFDLSRAATV